MNPRFALKSATDEAHERLDALIAQLDLSDPDDHARFLRIHSAVLPSLEDALERGGLDAILPRWRDHRRTQALDADLAAIGSGRAEPVPLPALDSIPAMLGAAYVLEGSRLGGQVLAGQVGAGLPCKFLGERGNIAPWPTLIAALDRLLKSEVDLDQAKATAHQVFDAYFLSAGRSGPSANE